MKKIFLFVVFVNTYIEANSFVIPSGTTATVPQVMNSVGDTGLIEAGGSLVDINGDVNIEAGNNFQSVTNYGTVTSFSPPAFESNVNLNVLGTNFRLKNYSIFNVIDSESGSKNVLVAGGSENAVLTNYGTFHAETRGAALTTINADYLAGNGKFINFGSLSSVAPQNSTAYNLRNTGINFILQNYGTLSSSHIGVWSSGENALIINGGVIHGDVKALEFTNTVVSSTLSLLLGSNIQGPVHVNASPLNLSVQTGLNLALTLDETSTAFGTLNIRAPFVLQTDPVVAVIDPTGLAMQSDITADISDSILAGIYDHRPCFECGAWTEAVASYRTRNAQSQTLQYNDWVAGFLTGYDGFYNGHALSIFAGALYTEALIESSYQKANIVSSCAGLMYEGCVYQTLVGLSAFGAYVNWDNARDVMNNLAPGGIDAANVGIHGGMFGADMTLRRALCSAYYRPTLGFNLRYAELFLGTYTETGSLTNLKVNHRNVGLITTRLEAAFSGFRSFIEPFIGVFGRYQVVGRNVSATLLDQTIDFQQGGPLNLVAGLIGARSYQAFGNTNTFFDVEASFDNAGSTRILGEVGLVY